jgi:hypothetical protein
MSLLVAGHAPDEMDVDFARVAEIGRAFDQMLQTLDPQLRLVWVKEGAQNFEDPGRWHIVRFHNNPELSAYWVIQNEDGSYCEPQMRHFERLQQMDTHTRDVMESIRQRRKAKDAARRKHFDEKRRMFRELLEERLEQIAGSSISVPRDIHVVRKQPPVIVTGEKPAVHDLEVISSDRGSGHKKGRL